MGREMKDFSVQCSKADLMLHKSYISQWCEQPVEAEDAGELGHKL